ncbi:hypothetical protein N7604_05820, partial [Klebsiella grimontii]|nr:hypothetical protein [Klebsiella grimontii]
FLPGGAALTGLRVHSVLRDGSPDRRASAASGESARPGTSARLLPGIASRPGYGLTAVCGTVARTGAPAPPPGKVPGLIPRHGFFPEALRRPGYGFTAFCETPSGSRHHRFLQQPLAEYL